MPLKAKSKKTASGQVAVEVIDNSDEVLAAFKEQLPLALEAIGGEMERHAKENCPVDTGRLRNSITFATATAQGNANTGNFTTPSGEMPKQAEPSDYAQHGSADECEVVVGTNVEYAAEQEYYGKKSHFLKNAATNHSEDYKKIVEAALKA